jgi:hypothetical protein
VLNLTDLTLFEHYGEVLHIDFFQIIIWEKRLVKERNLAQEDYKNPYSIFFIDHIKVGIKFVSLATISAIKILSRIHQNFKEIKMSISITKETLNMLLINSIRKIDVSVNTPTLSEAKYNLKFNKKYNLPLVLTKKIFNKLVDELRDYCQL